MDISTAFLIGDLEETSMRISQKCFLQMMVEMKNASYGLKQASTQGYHKLNYAYNSLNFSIINSENCIYAQ